MVEIHSSVCYAADMEPNSSSQLLQETLEHRILHGLSCEWETARWGLDASWQRLLQKPLFSLGEMRRRLGYWDADKREITISRWFVLNHPWSAVRDVLAHEMAHQVAHQVLGAVHETAHGPAFQKACRLLRIDARATGGYRPLGGDDGGPDKILGRVKKLFALAESRNVHEAEAAMLKAHELIAKYQVDLLALKEKRAYVSMLAGAPALRHTRDKYRLAHLLQDFYFVQGIWVPVYVVEKAKMGRALEISGTARNVEMASYVYDFILNYIDMQWRQYNDQGRYGHHRRTDFAVGVLDGFRRKLECAFMASRAQNSSRALIALQDTQLQEYMAFKYPHVRNLRRRALRVDAGVVRAGRAAGQNLVISKGISKKGRGRKLIEMV